MLSASRPSPAFRIPDFRCKPPSRPVGDDVDWTAVDPERTKRSALATLGSGTPWSHGSRLTVWRFETDRDSDALLGSKGLAPTSPGSSGLVTHICHSVSFGEKGVDMRMRKRLGQTLWLATMLTGPLVLILAVGIVMAVWGSILSRMVPPPSRLA